jgi:hypothetical protein
VLRNDGAGGLSVSLPRLRAPREHGGVLAEPPLEQAGTLLERNRRERLSASPELLGKPLTEVRRLAREEAWAVAVRYLAEGDEPIPDPPTPDQPWLLAGHQPELFHPGVWVKNFALKGLAQRYGAFSLNLVVDNDAARPPLLRVPSGTHVAAVPFDHWQAESPYEERSVLDEDLFATLPDRSERYFRGWPFTPLLSPFWRDVRRQAERTPLLGERLASARRAFERRWGCTQAEVPLSRVCQGEAFAWFACHLVRDARRLREAYNRAVHDYRRRYGLRNRFHPVPDLAEEGEWTETPLWAWRTGQKRRARLFVRQAGDAVQLRAGSDPWPALPLGGDPSRLVGAWTDLAAAGYKVRTRALTTTLYSRLVLGDLFIHGIGGGKYDELTDALIADFFGCPVPAFLVLSATLLLPLPRFTADPEWCRRLAREHRDLWYNPQRHFPGGSVPAPARDLVREKEVWVNRTPTTRDGRRERFEELRRLNEQLRPTLAAEEERLRRMRDECREHLRRNEVIGRRDYAFCLYPEEMLQDFVQRFVSTEPSAVAAG